MASVKLAREAGVKARLQKEIKHKLIKKKHRPMFTKEAPSPPRAPGFLMSDQNDQHKHKHKPISLSKNILFNMHITAVLLNDCVPT